MLVYMIVVHMLHMYVCVVIVFDKKILQISVKREINWIQQQSSPGFEEGGLHTPNIFQFWKG